VFNTFVSIKIIKLKFAPEYYSSFQKLSNLNFFGNPWFQFKTKFNSICNQLLLILFDWGSSPCNRFYFPLRAKKYYKPDMAKVQYLRKLGILQISYCQLLLLVWTWNKLNINVNWWFQILFQILRFFLSTDFFQITKFALHCQQINKRLARKLQGFNFLRLCTYFVLDLGGVGRRRWF
jgi:hypothetical protein